MIIYQDGKKIQIKTTLPVECKWNEKEKCLEISYTKEDGTKKKYLLRQSFKGGLVLN